jgi:uncharacterized membrane protein
MKPDNDLQDDWEDVQTVVSWLGLVAFSCVLIISACIFIYVGSVWVFNHWHWQQVVILLAMLVAIISLSGDWKK